MKKFEETTIDTEQIFNGHIIQVQVDTVKLPNDKISTREMVKHPGAVAIIPITNDGKILFVEQYRKPLEKSIVEIPAGKLEKGEEPIQTAVRELEEETGYTTATESLKFVDSFYTSPGFADEKMYIYLTTDIEKLDIEVEGDEDEFVELLELTLEEAFMYMKEERIHDAKTNYALMYVKAQGLM